MTAAPVASGGVTVLWDDALAGYDHGEGHPLRPVRLELTMALSRSYGLLERPGVQVRRPQPAADDLLELVHDPAYVGFVKSADDPRALRAEGFRYGFASSDNPVFPQMHQASALVSGASVDAAAAVWSGATRRALNLAGGLHHAMRDRASGFCVYDDPAVAIAWLLAHGASGSRTSMSTCTTATGCRPRSTPTRACSRSACTRAA